jgi:hypothetical protein
MFMIVYSTKFNFSKYNGPGVVDIKLIMNFNIQPPSAFVFLGFTKEIVESCLSFEDLTAYKI